MANFTNLQITIGDIHPLESLNFEKVNKSVKTVALLVNATSFIVVLIITSILWFLMKDDFSMILLFSGIMCLLIVLNFTYHWYYYTNLRYAMREKDITVKEGVIFLSSTTMPFSRVQHVEVVQSFLQRYFKIATIHLFTAGGTGIDLTIKGLDEEKAEKIKSYIISKTVYSETRHDEEE